MDLSTVVTAESFSGITGTVMSLLPLVIPVAIGFIGLRKGWSFITSLIKKS